MSGSGNSDGQRSEALNLASAASTWTQLALSQLNERCLHGVQVSVQIVGIRILEQQAGYDFTFGLTLLQIAHRGQAITRIVVDVQLAQPQHGTVVLGDLFNRSRRVVGDDLFRGPLMSRDCSPRRCAPAHSHSSWWSLDGCMKATQG
jgi:hypothetical protein